MPNVLGSTSFETQRTAISTLVDLDIALVLDRSESMASQAGGTHFHANSKNDLQIVFKEMARRLPTLLSKEVTPLSLTFLFRPRNRTSKATGLFKFNPKDVIMKSIMFSASASPAKATITSAAAGSQATRAVGKSADYLTEPTVGFSPSNLPRWRVTRLISIVNELGNSAKL